MYLLSCSSKRQALKKGKHVDRQETQQRPEQARVGLNFMPTPQGQVETKRLLSGDTNAVDDLKGLLARAEKRSRQVPRLNLNVRATEKFLQGNPEAIEDLLEEQHLAGMRVKKAAGRQWLGLSLMGNASLVGEPFENGCRDWCGDSLSSSTEVNDDGKCRGHWQLHYCSDGEGCHAQCPHPLTSQSCLATAEVVEKKTDQPAPSEEDDEEFPFDDHFIDEEDYKQALHEVTAFAVTPARARVILIPARTPSLTRKRGHSSLRESSSAVPSETAPSEYWSTLGSHGLLLKDQGGETPDGDHLPEGLGTRRSDLLPYRFRRVHLHLGLFGIRGPFHLP